MSRKSSRGVPYCAATLLLALSLANIAFAVVSEQAIYTFSGNPAGFGPLTKLVYRSGKLYGATTAGGAARSHCGTVFELIPRMAGGWFYRNLHSFIGGQDGCGPVGNIIFDRAGNIYGVTGSDGDWGFGTVYELSPGTDGKWTHQVLYAFFFPPDGESPDAGLIMDPAGNLFGTTSSGGNSSGGTVFDLSLGSNGLWNETVLYNFTGPDGDSPRAEVIMDAKGNLYGTTFSGGANSLGTVFKLSPNPEGGWSESVLYS